MKNMLRPLVIISVIIILVIAFVKIREGLGNPPLRSSKLETPSLISQTVSTLKPSPTSTPISKKKTTSTPKSTATPSPTPTPDIIPPTLVVNTPSINGEIYYYKDFCFAIAPSDNQSTQTQIQLNYQLNNGGWVGWQNFPDHKNGFPCLYNMANGNYDFKVKIRDAAGNESATVWRNFTVQYNPQ